MPKHVLDEKSVLKLARQTLKIEAAALEEVGRKIDRAFVRAVSLLLHCRGKVIILGMGKSGLIGQKIAGSLSSTGMPSFFVHPAEAAHGDLGTISKKDVLLAISYSGETEEVNRLLPLFHEMKVPIIALTGNKNSTLARAAEVVLDIEVPQEADPLNMIPTSSTTASLAVGDALLVVLIKLRGFKKKDFALLHPGGSAGRMLKKVSDLMHTEKEIPLVHENTSFKDALFEMTKKNLGTVILHNKKKKVSGIITDGDVRRIIQKESESPRLFSMPAKTLMTTNPKCIAPHRLAYEAVELMEKHNITVLPVINRSREVVGVIHIHDLVKAGFAVRQNEP